MKRRVLPFILGGALSIAAVAPAAAAPVAIGPAGSLIGIIVQVEDVLNDADIDVLNIDINNSLNNLLRNADIDVNVLNNLLQKANIDVTVTDITVVSDSLEITVLGGDTIVLS